MPPLPMFICVSALSPKRLAVLLKYKTQKKSKGNKRPRRSGALFREPENGEGAN